MRVHTETGAVAHRRARRCCADSPPPRRPACQRVAARSSHPHAASPPGRPSRRADRPSGEPQSPEPPEPPEPTSRRAVPIRGAPRSPEPRAAGPPELRSRRPVQAAMLESHLRATGLSLAHPLPRDGRSGARAGAPGRASGCSARPLGHSPSAEVARARFTPTFASTAPRRGPAEVGVPQNPPGRCPHSRRRARRVPEPQQCEDRGKDHTATGPRASSTSVPSGSTGVRSLRSHTRRRPRRQRPEPRRPPENPRGSNRHSEADRARARRREPRGP
jgi:hypothetical protein